MQRRLRDVSPVDLLTALPYRALRPMLFRLDPERSHSLAILLLRLGGLVRAPPGAPFPADARLRQELWGRTFPNPLGLAAGFDKDGVAVGALPLLGFGFGEVGTVTPRPQEGNPRPRLLRHPAQRSLQNALGFNNAGRRALRDRLRRLYPFRLPVGVNVGKNRDTSAARARDDYLCLVDCFGELCDFFVINVSSPNTPGLRNLQDEEFLRPLLAEAIPLTRRPILVKISPDLETAAAVALSSCAIEGGAAGVVIANTTIDYSLIPGARAPGGLSGAVLTERSRALLAAVARELFGAGILVSVGGVESGAEAYRRLRLGASLVQLYTALVYHGPGLPRTIVRELVTLVERDGARDVGEVIGADVPGGRRA